MRPKRDRKELSARRNTPTVIVDVTQLNEDEARLLQNLIASDSLIREVTTGFHHVDVGASAESGGGALYSLQASTEPVTLVINFVEGHSKEIMDAAEKAAGFAVASLASAAAKLVMAKLSRIRKKREEFKTVEIYGPAGNVFKVVKDGRDKK